MYKNILDLDAEELIKVSDSSFARRNSTRLMQFKPNSENCMKTGENDLAILNYAKSLELNPENQNAKDRLMELQKNK